MDNLIYILIGIAWVAYSLYSARQKAIQKQQSQGMSPRGPSQSSPLPIPGNQSGGKSLFEDILRELSGEPKPVPQDNRPAGHSKPAQNQMSVATKETARSSTAYTSIENYQTDFPVNELKTHRNAQLIHDQMTNKEKPSGKFNLREAVIYSELLNRKYF